MGAVKKLIQELQEVGGTKVKPMCRDCGEVFSVKRFSAGYRLCLFCGEEAAVLERRSWCVVPLAKSNYVLVRDRDLLVGINNKGGLVK
jgi:ribosomal protein L37AE/L43A